MTELSQSSYDEIPYDGNTFPSTHPDHLAVVATLCGMTPASAESCRVLELGCASGVNLLPLAVALPESRFVGIDLSERQIAQGRAIVEQLALPNIDLRAQSILDLDGTLGQFDYIICHGVYSWVPPEVQDKILDICKQQLAPSGVAYVSYNTYPWWHIRGLFRDMMCFHVRNVEAPQARLKQVRSFLKLLKESVQDKDGIIGRLYCEEAELLESMPDSYLYHEHLDGVNAPLYFHEFVARASAKGLQYLSETQFNDLLGSVSPELKEKIERLALTRVELEQYLDFIRVRSFRATLLCHDHIELNPTPSVEMFTQFRFTANGKPVSEQPDLFSTAEEEFSAGENATVSLTDPWAKTAVACLYEVWPEPVSFEGLRQAVLTRMEHGGAALPQGCMQAEQALRHCFSRGLLRAHLHIPNFVLDVSEWPLANPLARLQAERDIAVINQLHCEVQPDAFQRVLLSYLDGSRGHPALLEVLGKAAMAGGPLGIYDGGQRVLDAMRIREILSESLQPALQWLANRALLVS